MLETLLIEKHNNTATARHKQACLAGENGERRRARRRLPEAGLEPLTKKALFLDLDRFKSRQQVSSARPNDLHTQGARTPVALLWTQPLRRQLRLEAPDRHELLVASEDAEAEEGSGRRRRRQIRCLEGVRLADVRLDKLLPRDRGRAIAAIDGESLYCTMVPIRGARVGPGRRKAR